MSKLSKKHKGVNDRESFHCFLEELTNDFENNKNDWENRSLSSFLSALEGWVDDMDGYYMNIGSEEVLSNIKEDSWKIFADILMAGRIYE